MFVLQSRFHFESTDRETYGYESMNVDDKIDIPLSKNKIILHLFGSIIFVALFIFIIMELQPSYFMEVVGYCGVLFFVFRLFAAKLRRGLLRKCAEDQPRRQRIGRRRRV